MIFSPGKGAYQMKVRSVYAEREEDFFVFEWKEEDGQVDVSAPLQLLTTE
jgi:hypothetical protein